MRLGLIARCEIARGIAIQSKNFYDNMPVDRVLLVRMPRPDCVVAPDWYQNATWASYDDKNHQLDETLVREWLDGLDVVFTVETPNDWRMPLWCREMGVKLIIQGNPEFVRHTTDPSIPHPDAWWWPTKWRLDQLPAGKVMPVPMSPVAPAASTDDHRLHLTHVVGKRAYADRNGTDLLVQIMRYVRADVKLSVFGIDGQLPEFRRQRNIEFDLHPDGVDNKRDLYAGADVLVMPRRYGGLCLPALEAAASGLVVMMPDCSPNDELAAVRPAIQHRRPMSFACGPVLIVDVNTPSFAAEIDNLAQPAALKAAREQQSWMVPYWADWRQCYLDEMESML